jgi:hypothetical protein
MIHADLIAKDLATVEAFEQRLAGMDEVAELRRMFGIPDYFILVQVADAEAYEHWLTTQLLGDPAIARVDSRITMKLLKARPSRRTTATVQRPAHLQTTALDVRSSVIMWTHVASHTAPRPSGST